MRYGQPQKRGPGTEDRSRGIKKANTGGSDMKNENKRMGMGMMEDMMKGMMKGAGSMPEMCMKIMEQMMDSATDTANLASSEMKGLFEEWLKILEGEIMAFVKEKEKTSPSAIAAHFKLSQDNVLFLIGKLAREEKLTIGEIRASA
jgi:hypothetical protein